MKIHSLSFLANLYFPSNNFINLDIDTGSHSDYFLTPPTCDKNC